MTLPPNFNILVEQIDFMSTKPLNETELAQILQIAQDGGGKFREMSDRATIIAEKWRIKTQTPDWKIANPESKIASAIQSEVKDRSLH